MGAPEAATNFFLFGPPLGFIGFGAQGDDVLIYVRTQVVFFEGIQGGFRDRVQDFRIVRVSFYVAEMGLEAFFIRTILKRRTP